MNINLAPIKFSNKSLIENVINELRRRFFDEVKVIELDIDIENAYSRERSQYYSTQIIADAIESLNNNEGKIVILTEFDLFIPVLTYVYGEAQLNGKYSVVSVCRLHEEFYSGRTDDKLLLDRTLKEILHELGHNFGLVHCQEWDCVMHSSMGIEEVDIKGSGYCKNCAESVEGYKAVLI